jgi:hypothetical protein
MSFQSLFGGDSNPLDGMINSNNAEMTVEYMQQYLKIMEEIDRFTKDERKTLDSVKERLLSPTEIKFESTDIGINQAEIKLANPNIQTISFALKPTSRSQYVKGVALEIFTWMKFSLLVPPLLLIHHYLSGVVGRTGFNTLLSHVLRESRRARRYRIRPHNVLMKDARAPILYLRAFSEDYPDRLEGINPRTSEERMVSFYNQYGPVIAIGQPTEDIPLLGALRLYFDDKDWQAGVAYLMSVAQLVIIHAGIAPGLLWELGIARQKLDPQRLVISFHGWSDYKVWDRLKQYRSFRKYAIEILNCDLPKFIVAAGYMTFDQNWTPILWGEVKPHSESKQGS